MVAAARQEKGQESKQTDDSCNNGGATDDEATIKNGRFNIVSAFKHQNMVPRP